MTMLLTTKLDATALVAVVAQDQSRRKVRRTSHGAIGEELRQLSFAFLESPSMLDAMEMQFTPDAPDVLELDSPPTLPGLAKPRLAPGQGGKRRGDTGHRSTRDPELAPMDGVRIDNMAYVSLAIELLLTCAEDLDIASQKLAQVDCPADTREKALALQFATKGWLLDEVESPFSFKSCTELLEEELAYQSLGQVSLPAIADRRDELAQWLIDNPQQARQVLSRYLVIFRADDGEADIYGNQFADTPSAATERPRG